MPAQEHYPEGWDTELPAVIVEAFHARDGVAVHRFARALSGQRDSQESQRCAAIAHLLAFALDMVAVQEKRLQASGAKGPPIVLAGTRSNRPTITSGIRECKDPERGPIE